MRGILEKDFLEMNNNYNSSSVWMVIYIQRGGSKQNCFPLHIYPFYPVGGGGDCPSHEGPIVSKVKLKFSKII